MSLTLGLTLGERIKLSENLPKKGTIEFISKIKEIKNILVGFANAQLINWRIVPSNGTYITALPDTLTSITLEPEQIKTYASYIREKSVMDGINIDEAEIYKKIIEEAEKIEKEEFEALMQNSQESVDNE